MKKRWKSCSSTASDSFADLRIHGLVHRGAQQDGLPHSTEEPCHLNVCARGSVFADDPRCYVYQRIAQDTHRRRIAGDWLLPWIVRNCRGIARDPSTAGYT
ncbi:hypothetical protein M758_UG233400 [Ceratodon purpureus]|nr:hypothetical protein M758_UG233400 [Ceratodon purpureus]